MPNKKIKNDKNLLNWKKKLRRKLPKGKVS